MDNSAQRPSYQQVKAMIKQFTGQANTLVIPRVFIDFTGDHLAAMLLSQILYWSDKTTDPDGWFYKTADEWQSELGMSAYQVKRAATVLEKFGIETKVRKVKTAPKMHYRVDMPLFTDLFLKFLENQEIGKSRNYNIDNQETSKSMDYEETQKSYKEHRLPETTSERAPARAPDELALTIADVCKINPKLAIKKQKDGLNATYQALKAIDATPADVRARERWWYANDWRAQREHRPPRPEELQEIWEMVKVPAKAAKAELIAPTARLAPAKPTAPPDVKSSQETAAGMKALLEKHARERNAP